MTALKYLLMILLVCHCSPLLAQVANEIIDVSPNSAVQGDSGVLVTLTLDTDFPPAPPAGIDPISVTIGNLSGSSITHTEQYAVTAVFSIPVSEPVGARDVNVTFETPQDSLVFGMTGGFTVEVGADTPPTITKHPTSISVRPGAPVTFTVDGFGTEPLHFQWQHNGIDIETAQDPSYQIDSAISVDAGTYHCRLTNDFGSAVSNDAVLTVTTLTPAVTQTYTIVDTGQVDCYDDLVSITCPDPGQAFYGQDAQIAGNTPSYTLNSDGFSVYDNVTGLTWQRSPDLNHDGVIDATDKLTWTEAQALPQQLNAMSYGGYDDWRLPTIKELYSLILFSGMDPSSFSGTETSGLTPFIDTTYFDFAYGDTGAGERIIDAQYASSSLYAGNTNMLFGVNFADGRIKGYGLVVGGSDKTFYVICVRGNTAYGVNDFVDNEDGTITDNATGLMWAKNDSEATLNWEEALAWVAVRNGENYLGYSDWRLPDVKELESIVDYTRSPDSTASAALDPVFNCTTILNELNDVDYPYFWAGSTHASENGMGSFGTYVSFGRAMGYLDGGWQDVHGAGAQRSDPKDGDPDEYPTGHGPQGDAIRIFNDVRLVREGAPTQETPTPVPTQTPAGPVPSTSAASGATLLIALSVLMGLGTAGRRAKHE